MSSMDDSARPKGRLHDLDGLRATLMLLVCIGHALLIYSYGPPWFITSPDKSWAITYLNAFLTAFHMPAFFLLAGYFSALSLKKKTPGAWLGSRATRLLLPMVTAMLVVSPFVILAGSLAAEHSQVARDNGFIGILSEDLAVFGHRWIGHLWFLPALFVLSALTALLAKTGVLKPLANTIGTLIARMPKELGWSLMVMAASIWLFIVIGAIFFLEARFGYQPPLGGLFDLRAWLSHAPFFLLGVVFVSRPEAMDALTRITRYRLLLALALVVPYLIVAPSQDMAGRIIRTALEGGVALSFTFLSMAAARHLFVRENAAVTALSRYSLSIYLVHYPIVALLGLGFQPHALPALFEVALIIVIMMVSSLVIAWLIDRSATTRWLFNGMPMPKPRPAAAETEMGRVRHT